MLTRKRFACIVGAVAVLSLLGSGMATAAEGIVVKSPAAGGFVDLGDEIRFEVEAADCSKVTAVAILRHGTDPQQVLSSPAATGCQGTLVVPGDPYTDFVRATPVVRFTAPGVGAQEVPLQPKRKQAEDFTAAGAVSAGDAYRAQGPIAIETAVDPFGGGTALMRLQNGHYAAYGPTNLTGISSVTYRVAAEGIGGRVELRRGAPDGPVIATTDVPASGGAQAWTGVTTKLVAPPTDTFDLFVRFTNRPETWSNTAPINTIPRPSVPLLSDVPYACAIPSVENTVRSVEQTAPVRRNCDPRYLLNLNFIEFNGTGSALPFRYVDGPGWEYLDITDSTVWQHVGEGGFTVNEADKSVTSFGSQGIRYFSTRQQRDFSVRFEWRPGAFENNSGIFVRFPQPDYDVAVNQGYEVQIDDKPKPNQRTGGMYNIWPSERLATNTVGEWNVQEITAIGQQYTITINGIVVSRFVGDRSLEGFFGFQSHDATSTVSFRNVRLREL